jgi:hypothetical protein
MPHHLLKRCNPHVLIRFVRAKGMPERMHPDPFADARLFHVFGNGILNRLQNTFPKI